MSPYNLPSVQFRGPRVSERQTYSRIYTVFCEDTRRSMPLSMDGSSAELQHSHGLARVTRAVGTDRRRPSRTNDLIRVSPFEWNADKNDHARLRDRSTRSALAHWIKSVGFDGFIPANHVRSDPKKWGSRPCGTPYRRDPTLALGVRCHPFARWTPNSDHAMRHILVTSLSQRDCSRHPHLCIQMEHSG